MKSENKNMKIVVFNVINALLLVLLVFILYSLPKIAQDVKKARGESIIIQESSEISVLSSEIEKNRETIDKINSSLVNESKFLEFISAVENIQINGILSEFTFPVSKPTIDGGGNLGFPVSLTFRGTEESINSEIERLLSLPFLLRVLNAGVEISPEPENIVVKMSLFLYVNEEFKN